MKKLTLSLAVATIAGLASVANAALADGGAKFLGNITTGGAVRSDMGTYWNQITAENGCKWGSVHSLSGGNSGTSQFSWDNYDKCEGAYKWAKEKPGERHFKFHALVWGSQYPNFLCKKKNPNITVEITKQYITEWFDAVAAKFPDLEYIDVVNEAIFAGDNYHSGFGKPAAGAEGHSTDDTECGGSYIIEALGGDEVINGKHQYNFITTAFKMARERWPKAVLIYNDYNTIQWQMNEGIELIQTIIANGAPVDAYGQQAHDCKGLSQSDFESKLTTIHQKTGLPLLISEYDISEANDESQKNNFANHIPFMWETEWIGGITLWGYINGSTWVENTGIINETNGTSNDRAAMTWLKDYFAKNLSKGKNTTQLGEGNAVEPEPQTAFKNHTIPGKIEAEDFDIPGVGSGNDSYNENDATNHGDSDYRDGTGVDLYSKATGIVVGYNAEGDWLEYTVNVTETGDYTLFAAVASASDGSSLQFLVDGENLTSVLSVPAATQGEENYEDYNKVSANVYLTQGTHIIRMKVVSTWFDIDYFTFVKGKDATDPEPITIGRTPIANRMNLEVNTLQDYQVFNQLGMRIGTISAYGISAAIDQLKSSSALKSSGVYYLKNRATGVSKSVRIER